MDHSPMPQLHLTNWQLVQDPGHLRTVPTPPSGPFLLEWLLLVFGGELFLIFRSVPIK